MKLNPNKQLPLLLLALAGSPLVKSDYTLEAEVNAGTLWNTNVYSSHLHTKDPGDPSITSTGKLNSIDETIWQQDKTLTTSSQSWGSGAQSGECGMGYAAFTSSPGLQSGYDSTIQACGTPLLIDLGRDGLSLGEQGVYVDFDMNADDEIDSVQWVAQGGNEVFLALGPKWQWDH